MTDVSNQPATAQATGWTPKKLYGVLAAAEMVTWALLILGMVLKYSGVSDAFVPVFGTIHGVTFLSYCVVTVFVWVNQKWSFGLGLTGLASSIIPFLTLPFERWVQRKGLLEGGWRLVPGGDAPQGFVENVQAWCLRRPLLAVLLGIVFVAVLASVLIWMGPPIPKG